MDAASLMARARDGDREAFGKLFREFCPKARLYFLRYHHDEDLAEDCVQDLFEKLWTKRGLYRGDGSFPGYFYSMASHVAADRYRRERTWRSGADSFEEGARMKSAGTDAAPDVGLRKAEVAGSVDRAIRSLPPPLRDTFLMSRTQGLAYGEIAEALGISVKAVEKRMTQCFDRLRELLAGVG